MFQFFKDVHWFFATLIKEKDILGELIKRDIKDQYMGAHMGFLWLFVQPLFFIGIVWLVHSQGLPHGLVKGMSFALYLISGLAVWNYFSNTLMANTMILSQYTFLVRKASFNLSVLPLVKIVSGYVPHMVIVIALISITLYEKITLSPYVFQLLYYDFCAVVFLLGLGWLTSALNSFVKDVVKIIGICLQFGFWLTPIIWNFDMLGSKMRMILQLNPIGYIVIGYRDSLVHQIPFWHHWGMTLYFWGLTLFILFLGALVFKRLRPHFAAVM